MTLIKVEPTGEHASAAFVDYADGHSEIKDVSVSEYPPTANGELLRVVRLAKNITIRDASSRLQIRPSELSGLEAGRLALSPEDWAELFKKLNED